jgi:hypothetical protein
MLRQPFINVRYRWAVQLVVGLTVATAVCSVQAAQVNRGWQPLKRIDAGTVVVVRTSEEVIADSNMDGRVFNGVIDQDVRDTNGRLAIPQGASVELMVRSTSNNDFALDLDSVMVEGQRYAIDASPNSVGTSGSPGGLGTNRKTAEYVGGGALLGTLVGAIAGGGKGAAIGAAVGAAAGAGAQVVTQGRNVSVPAESVLTFRLERGLDIGVRDSGFNRDGYHYHSY